MKMAQKVQVLIIYKGLAENAPYFYIISKESKTPFISDSNVSSEPLRAYYIKKHTLYANYYAMPKMISISLTTENVSFYSAISDILMVVPNIFLS